MSVTLASALDIGLGLFGSKKKLVPESPSWGDIKGLIFKQYQPKNPSMNRYFNELQSVKVVDICDEQIGIWKFVTQMLKNI